MHGRNRQADGLRHLRIEKPGVFLQQIEYLSVYGINHALNISLNRLCVKYFMAYLTILPNNLWNFTIISIIYGTNLSLHFCLASAHALQLHSQHGRAHPAVCQGPDFRAGSARDTNTPSGSITWRGRSREGVEHDEDILHAACFLHDIEMSVGHPKSSADRAEAILHETGFVPEKIPLVLEAILNHMPDGKPVSAGRGEAALRREPARLHRRRRIRAALGGRLHLVQNMKTMQEIHQYIARELSYTREVPLKKSRDSPATRSPSPGPPSMSSPESSTCRQAIDSDSARRFLAEGHLIDSGLLTRMLNLIVDADADYEDRLPFTMGKVRTDSLRLEIEVKSRPGRSSSPCSPACW